MLLLLSVQQETAMMVMARIFLRMEIDTTDNGKRER